MTDGFLSCSKFFFFFVTVPSPVPQKSLKGTPFEDKIFLNWKEPMDPNGIITQYEVLKCNWAEESGYAVSIDVD